MARPVPTCPDAQMAARTADAFFQQACAFFATLPIDINKSAEICYLRRGALTAATTSLAFSVELYLKALLMTNGQKVKMIHNLLRLFQELPQLQQESIDAQYRARLADERSDGPSCAELFITTTPVQPTAEEMAALDANAGVGEGVVALLDAEKDAFRSWRYIHEADMPKGITLFRVEFRMLSVLISVLRQGLLTDGAA